MEPGLEWLSKEYNVRITKDIYNKEHETSKPKL